MEYQALRRAEADAPSSAETAPHHHPAPAAPSHATKAAKTHAGAMAKLRSLAQVTSSTSSTPSTTSRSTETPAAAKRRIMEEDRKIVENEFLLWVTEGTTSEDIPLTSFWDVSTITNVCACPFTDDPP